MEDKQYKYTYHVEETSQDTRNYTIESDVQLTHDEIVDCLGNVSINNKKNSFVGEDGIKTTFEDTDWGDDSQIDISGDEMKEAKEDYEVIDDEQ
jgi:hypothetical protein